MDLTAKTTRPTFAQAFRFWLKLGFISFGGPTGQIAIMHTELVEKKKWISESRFLHALNYCMLLPGPEAQQLAIYVGWLLHRTWGGIVAGILFVLPSALILWGLSYVYVAFGNVQWVAGIFYGVKAAVLAIVMSAVIRIGKKVLKNEMMWGFAGLSFVAIYFLKAPFPVIILLAALVGVLGGRWKPKKFLIIKEHGSNKSESVIDDSLDAQSTERPSLWRVARVTTFCLALWWIPVLMVGLLLGWQHTLFKESVFFSKAAMVTFGGAYAVLPYVSQQAVEHFHWLSAGQMLDGLGLAETTPGPLIMVLQFVGFLGAWHQPGSLSPFWSATLGALFTTWTTFLPCFLWIFVGAPYIEYLRGNKNITAALSVVTAAVVGVVLNLGIWFGMHVLFPAGHQVDFFALVVSVLTLLGMMKCKWGVIPVVLVASVLGLVYKTFIP